MYTNLSGIELDKNIKIQIEVLRSIDQIKDTWNYIDSNAEENFFLSWNWINAWLTSTINKFDLIVVTAYQTDKPIGIAIFTEIGSTRHKVLPTKQWWLNKTGNEKYDQTWIEQNDFLLDKQYAEATRQAMWEAIKKNADHVDEFILGMSSEKVIDVHKSILSEYLQWNFIESKGWSTQLSDWQNFDTYWQSRSKNFKSQLKRTEKILKAQNAEVSISTDSLSFIEGLKKAEPWHIKHWRQDSGFNNKIFVKHFDSIASLSHEKNLENLFTLEIKLNHKTIAVCLGFYTSTTLYFYLSAQEDIQDNKLKVGLYLHHQAIKWCYQHNLVCYDFLAGDYRYKRSFANKATMFYLTHFQRDCLKFRIENTLKRIKSNIYTYFKVGS